MISQVESLPDVEALRTRRNSSARQQRVPHRLGHLLLPLVQEQKLRWQVLQPKLLLDILQSPEGGHELDHRLFYENVAVIVGSKLQRIRHQPTYMRSMTRAYLCAFISFDRRVPDAHGVVLTTGDEETWLGGVPVDVEDSKLVEGEECNGRRCGIRLQGSEIPNLQENARTNRRRKHKLQPEVGLAHALPPLPQISKSFQVISFHPVETSIEACAWHSA